MLHTLPISCWTFAMLYSMNVILSFGHEANMLGLIIQWTASTEMWNGSMRTVTERNYYYYHPNGMCSRCQTCMKFKLKICILLAHGIEGPMITFCAATFYMLLGFGSAIYLIQNNVKMHVFLGQRCNSYTNRSHICHELSAAKHHATVFMCWKLNQLLLLLLFSANKQTIQTNDNYQTERFPSHRCWHENYFSETAKPNLCFEIR